MIVNEKFTIDPFASPLQEEILHILSQGPVEGMDLLKQITIKPPVTKQGLYKILRKLLYNEVVIKEGNFFSLNKVWIYHLNDFIEESKKKFGISLPFLDTNLTDRKIITFKNAEALNIYWGHLFLVLGKKFSDKPFFFFNHHSWFIYGHPHLETYLYKTSLKKSQKIMITLGSNTSIAKKFKSDFMKSNIQITIDEKFPVPKTNHLCIIGDYFIVTKYDSKTMTQIDSLFTNAISFGETEIKKLHKILSTCKKPKIIITKNNKKANVWKRRFAKNFVIKKAEL